MTSMLHIVSPAVLLVVGLALVPSVRAYGVPEEGAAPEGASAKAFEERVTKAGGHVAFVFEDDRPFAQCHASTIVQAADGRLLCAWFGGTEEKNPDVRVWLSRFDGKAWSKPESAAKATPDAHWNPVLLGDAAGVVSLFFKAGVDEVHWSTWWMQSDDGGDTWSEPKELTPGDVGGRGPVKNKPIILSDGAWLSPASLEVKEGKREIWTAFSDRSVDGGKTWTRSADFAVDKSKGKLYRGPGAIQPTFWESKPGHVHALLRTGAGVVWRTDSSDGGLTWNEVRATDLPNNNSGLDALRLEDGRVLLVYNPVGKNWGARTPLDLAVSDDNGATWKTIAHLEDDPDQESEYSYPAIVGTKDGIAVCYTWQRQRIRAWLIPFEALSD